MALTDALQEIVDTVGALPGMRISTDDPPEQIAAFPTAVVYVTGGGFNTGPFAALNETYTTRIDSIVARADLKRGNAQLAARARDIPNALYGKLRAPPATRFQHILSLGAISLQMLAATWGGVEVLFYRYEFDLTIQTRLD